MSSVAEVVVRVELIDIDALCRDEGREALGWTGHVQGWVAAVNARLARRLQVIAETDGAIMPEADIATASKSTRSEAGKATRRAKTLGEVPQLEDALAAGDVSTEHVDALGRATRRLKPEDRSKLTGDRDRLAEIAARSTPEEFESHLKGEIDRIDSREGGERLSRQRRAIRLRSWTDKDSGMVVVRAELDPWTGMLVTSRIDKTVDRLFREATPDDCPTDPEQKQDFLRAAAFARLILRRKRPSADEADADADADADDRNDADRDDADVDRVDDSDSTDIDDAGADVPNNDPVQPGLFADSADSADCDHAHNGERPAVPKPTRDPGSLTGLELMDYDNTCDMVVVIDLDTIIGGLHERSIIDNGTSHDLPIESYRRMACTAAIIPVVLNGDGVCLDLGRETRLANRAQRRALAAMYKTCAIPGCTVSSRHCQPHHIRWWRRLGLTDLDNLLPLCSRHHHAAHEGGWQLVMHPDRSLTITYPDGSIQETGPPATYQRPRPTRRTATLSAARRNAA